MMFIDQQLQELSLFFFGYQKSVKLNEMFSQSMNTIQTPLLSI